MRDGKPSRQSFDGNNYLLFGFNRQQFPADFGMSSSPSSNGNEKMPVFCFEEIKMAGLDAYPALDAFVLFEYGYAIPDDNGLFFAVLDTGPASRAEAGVRRGGLFQ
ncbi:MAG: hypothetical protein MZV70_30740 [Desulfobacterales bacterium]|nr:hypothetical protein [Desulfobacterales bacterium]